MLQQNNAHRIHITLKPVDRRGRFSAEFADEIIVKASTRPMIEAAKVLSAKGYSDDFLLVARHIGADHDAMWGNLGAIIRSVAANKDVEDDDPGVESGVDVALGS